MLGQPFFPTDWALSPTAFSHQWASQRPSRQERVFAGLAVLGLHLILAFALIFGAQPRHYLHPIVGAGLQGEIEVSVRSLPITEPARPQAPSMHALSNTQSHAARPTPAEKQAAKSTTDVGATPDLGAAGRDGAPSAPAQLGNMAPATNGAAAGAAGSDYGRKLLEHIEQNKRYPKSGVSDRPSGVVRVLFTVTRNGSVSGVWVQSGSGSPALDREAVATLLRAQPLPPIPADLPDPLNFSFAMEFSPPSVVLPE